MSTDETNGHARFRDDVAPWLLGALADDERQEFERHLAACGRCREEVAALRPAVAALPLAAPPVVPSPELRDRIMSVVESEAQLLEAAGEHADRPPKAARGRRRLPAFGRLRPALVGGLAALVVAVGVGGYLIGNSDSGGGEHVVTAKVSFPAAQASVHTEGDQASLQLANMPAPPPGRVYQVWLKRDGQNPQPTRALFVVSSGSVTIPGGIKGADQVLVTAEPRGGSLQPTTQPVIVAKTANPVIATAASVANVATQTCYRHPGRETGVSCSSCGRPICPDCMTPSPVGMRCPECSRQSTRVTTAEAVRSGGAEQPVVTYALIAICIVAFVGEMAGGAGLGFGQAGGAFVEKGALFGPSISINHEYWRLITSGFLHAGFLHIGFNMYLLWYLGRLLEPALGHVRFAAIYFTSLLAGSFGALLLAPNTVTIGASGAVFGLMGAAVIEFRRRGIGFLESGIGILILFNLGLSFIVPGIAIGGHIGGLIGGVLAALAINLGARFRSLALSLAGCVVLSAVAVMGALAVA